ncbi:helix-turn-helix domain-containing protein [Seinonella peptonophila]|uniref:helix-turn-helix domain-containing protein n=1 Tax=Seinonella peptonophila TaxID=112248 RepID=UPI000933DE9F
MLTTITYIQSNRSAMKATQKLHIHVNTLYQRLNKIEQILQLFFKTPTMYDNFNLLVICVNHLHR